MSIDVVAECEATQEEDRCYHREDKFGCNYHLGDHLILFPEAVKEHETGYVKDNQ